MGCHKNEGRKWADSVAIAVLIPFFLKPQHSRQQVTMAAVRPAGARQKHGRQKMISAVSVSCHSRLLAITNVAPKLGRPISWV